MKPHKTHFNFTPTNKHLFILENKYGITLGKDSGVHQACVIRLNFNWTVITQVFIKPDSVPVCHVTMIRCTLQEGGSNISNH